MPESSINCYNAMHHNQKISTLSDMFTINNWTCNFIKLKLFTIFTQEWQIVVLNSMLVHVKQKCVCMCVCVLCQEDIKFTRYMVKINLWNSWKINKNITNNISG